MVAIIAASLVVAGAAPAPVPPQQAVPEPDGYKLDKYRDPVPATIHGGKVIHIKPLADLIAGTHPVLIDVLPAPIRPPGENPDRPWLPLPHKDIPGSLWLPDVGRGALSPVLDTWFREKLAVATSGNRSVPVVFYCLSQCWMSWNATKRAISYGYKNAIWFPEGADGWEKAGGPVQTAQPESAPPA